MSSPLKKKRRMISWGIFQKNFSNRSFLALQTGTNFGRPVAGAEIAADLAPPDGIKAGKRERGVRPGGGFLSFLLWGTPLGMDWSFCSPFKTARKHKGRSSSPVIIQIRVPIVAGQMMSRSSSLLPEAKRQGQAQYPYLFSLTSRP